MKGVFKKQFSWFEVLSCSWLLYLVTTSSPVWFVLIFPVILANFVGQKMTEETK